MARPQHLNPGDQLLTPDGARVIVIAVIAVIAVVAYNAVATVHNLTIDDFHTYYIRTGDADVLVHNCGAKAANMFRNLYSPRYGPGVGILWA